MIATAYIGQQLLRFLLRSKHVKLAVLYRGLQRAIACLIYTLLRLFLGIFWTLLGGVDIWAQDFGIQITATEKDETILRWCYRFCLIVLLVPTKYVDRVNFGLLFLCLYNGSVAVKLG